jgi:predicted PurR-regulated permease PerM
MSRSVELHPLAIALAVLSGTLLSGIVGALLAVPLVAFLNSTVLALRRGPDAVPAAKRGTVEVPEKGDGSADV